MYAPLSAASPQPSIVSEGSDCEQSHHAFRPDVSAAVDRRPELIELPPSSLNSYLHIHVPEISAIAVQYLWQWYHTHDNDLALPLPQAEQRWPGVQKLERCLSWCPTAAATAKHIQLPMDIRVDQEMQSTHAGHVHMLDIISQDAMAEPLVELTRQTRHSSEQSASLKRKLTDIHDVLQKKLYQYEQGKTPYLRATRDHPRRTSELASFLHLHGTSHRSADRIEEQPAASAIRAVQERPVHTTSASDSADPAHEPLERSDEAFQITVGQHMLARTALIASLEYCMPRLRIVERTPVSRVAASIKQSIEDADISLSPDVGIMLVDMQRLKQKPLPGQSKQQTSLQTNVMHIAMRYAKLLVIVRTSFARAALQEGDCAALAEFAGTVGAVRGIELHYFSGSDADLACLLVRHCRRYCVNDININTEETRHENLLRRLGLNPYAAQAVLDGSVIGSSDKLTISVAVAAALRYRQDEHSRRRPSSMNGQPAPGWFG